MRILVVNPNITASMTEKIGAAARSVASAGTEIVAVNPDHGPASIEGPYDEAMCVPPTLERIRAGAEEGFDGFVLACFDDPGLAACRSAVPQPVVGICEAAMYSACLIAHSFSVVTTLPVAIPVIENLALRYGMERRLRRVRACDVPVLALEEPGGEAAARVRDQVLAAVREDGAEAVILGCAGMADLTAALTEETSTPVLDGVACAVKQVEVLVSLGLRTAKTGAYAPPRPKPFA